MGRILRVTQELGSILRGPRKRTASSTVTRALYGNLETQRRKWDKEVKEGERTSE